MVWPLAATSCGMKLVAVLTNDVVGADDATAVEQIVDEGGLSLDLVAQGIGNTGRRDFFNLALIFGFVIEEFVFANYLCKRKNHHLSFVFYHAASEFTAFDEFLEHNLIACVEGSLNSLVEIFCSVDLAYAYA